MLAWIINLTEDTIMPISDGERTGKNRKWAEEFEQLQQAAHAVPEVVELESQCDAIEPIETDTDMCERLIESVPRVFVSNVSGNMRDWAVKCQVG